MALPTQNEILKLSIVHELTHGHSLSNIYDSLVAAIDGNACGPDVETEEPACKTPLLRAVESGDFDYIQNFILLGADIDHETVRGETALSSCLKLSNQPMIDYLIQLGARLDHINKYAESSLTHLIRICNDPDSVQWILNQPRRPPVRPCDITEAIIQGKHRVLVMLLEHDLKLCRGKESKSSGIEGNGNNAHLNGVKEEKTMDCSAAAQKEETEEIQDKEEKEKSLVPTLSTATAPNNYTDHLLEEIDLTCMRSPLMTAASGGKCGTVVLLLDRGASPGKSFNMLLLLQHWCVCCSGVCGIVSNFFLLFDGTIFCMVQDQESPVGHTALSIASFNGHNETVRALLSRNVDSPGHVGAGAADVNYETSTGHTPLLQTCVSGQADTTRILLLNGADPNLQNKQNETALTTAARCGHADVVMALMTGGAKINQETRTGRTPLHEALRCNHPTVVAKLIIDVGIGLNLIPQRTEEPRTPLMTAVLNGSVEALEVLLTKVIPKDINQLGVDLHFETTKNQTALDVAILYGQSETALVVIESMVKYTTYLNEQEGVEYNQKILITRMLLSKLQRFIKKSLLHETELRNNKNNAETCQNAQAVTESMNQGLKMVEIMLEDMIDARHADDDIAAAIDRQRYTNA